ncbi:MAG: hypothetical protein IJ287_00685 [Methanobrevibacter sp.]|nr:hypothetical protein [Methanobrevibacter sp.]
MNKKTITLLLVVIFSISCLGMVWADNNTTNATEQLEIEDTTNYIMPISITDNGIKFSDGFTGYCIDLTKNSITTDDKFTTEHTTDSENAIKLAIIECYKANKENDIENIISKVINKDSSDDIAKKVLSSKENIGDSAVVEINNDTEATFNFELLKSNDVEKSDCVAYKVSLKTIKHDDILSAVNGENKTANSTNNNTTTSNNKTDSENAETVQNNTKTNASEKTVIETNKTIINKTNTVTVNENNTTIINQNNTKIINKTNETPQNATLQNKILRTVGNPIFLLVIVIIIIAVVAVTIRGKG